MLADLASGTYCVLLCWEVGMCRAGGSNSCHVSCGGLLQPALKTPGSRERCAAHYAPDCCGLMGEADSTTDHAPTARLLG
jgi:hypothetical protein